MTYEQIHQIIQKNSSAGITYQIRFKTREAITGLFLQAPDYHELSRKNFWRFVGLNKMEEYKKSGNVSLARIFNGSEFKKIEVLR